MLLERLEVGPLMANCYIVADPASGEAVVVDPGGSPGRILDALKRLKVSVTAIVNTHAHFDHVEANGPVKAATGAPILIHASEAGMLPHLDRFGLLFGMRVSNSPPADGTLDDGDTVPAGSITMEVIHLPGHSPGGICLSISSEKAVIVGDALFAGSIGRTDFPGGSHEQLIDGIRRRLFSLPDETKVWPGHGPETTIGREKRTNPFF